MWHVSVSFWLTKREPLKLSGWRKGVMTKAREIAEAELVGVGTGEIIYTRGESCAHFRKKLSDEEIAKIDPEFLTCPAIDFA